MNRTELFAWVRAQYDTEPDYPWKDTNAVLRHKDNNKWYGVVLTVPAEKIGLPGGEMAELLNIKSEPELIGSLRQRDGFFPAYHMNKERWISVMLGGPTEDEEIKALLAMSYELTRLKR